MMREIKTCAGFKNSQVWQLYPFYCTRLIAYVANPNIIRLGMKAINGGLKS
jgi:hypothetical protein